MSFRNWVLSFFSLVWCDRCKAAVDGFLGGDDSFSAGVYVDWPHNKPGEHIVCDKCMWKDEGFLAIYPHMRGKE